MPSKSKAQAHLMAAVAHGWEPPGKHIPESVGKEFHAADKKKGKWEHLEGKGHSGKMEKLKGTARTSAEKSHEHRHGKGGRY